MNDSAGVALSVRAEARRTVPPDCAMVDAAITASAQSRRQAVSAVSASLDGLTADLAALGGVALGEDTERRPLTWSARSVATWEEHRGKKGNPARAVTVRASVDLMVTVRDFDLLDRLYPTLTGHHAVEVGGVSWLADWDNPAWPEVRADAIRAAVRKGRDYAAALGGSLSAVDHIADIGLLGAGGGGMRYPASRGAMLLASSGDEAGGPSLTPVPQELAAAVEARFTATGISLAGQ